MSIRRSLLLCKTQQRMCSNKALPQPMPEIHKTDKNIFGFALCVAVVGGVYNGIGSYNTSRKHEKGLSNYDIDRKKDYWKTCLMETTSGVFLGMSVGFCAVYLMPVVLPIGIMVMGARYMDPPPPPESEVYGFNPNKIH